MATEGASGSTSQTMDETFGRTVPQNTTNLQTKLQEQTDVLPSSTPVEMSQLSQHQPSSSQPLPDAQTIASNQTADASPPPTVAGISESQTAPATTSTCPVEHAASPISILPGPGPTATSPTDAQTASSPPSAAIGPPLDQNAAANTISPSTATEPSSTHPTTSSSTPDSGLCVLITLILLTGKRHPFKIDTEYLKKRNIFKDDAPDADPYGISIYTLKELIWRDWRDEWELRPTHPGSIRLIHFGKLLEDKVVLKDMKLQPATPNILHMSVKPQDLVDEEENAKLKGGKPNSSRSRLGLGGGGNEDGETSAGCCRCVVM